MGAGARAGETGSAESGLRAARLESAPMKRFLRLLAAAAALSALAACITVGNAPTTPAPPPRIALALGGGAARGFAHIGVIKALEAQGIVPDIVVGTSAGALVGALYAAGNSGFELQKIALQMDESQIGDWTLPDRGVFKGEALQGFVNKAVGYRTLEKLAKPFGAVATDLHTGEAVVFRTGDTGMAVRASGSVPGVFQPVSIAGREYVDGGLVNPIPVRAARSMGAQFVIAVDISARPQNGKTRSALDVLLQTFAIMGQTLGRFELAEADVVIRPTMVDVAATDFKGRHVAVMEGEKAVAAMLPEIRAKLAKLQEALRN